VLKSVVLALAAPLVLLMGCVAQEELILPTKYERIAQSDAYKRCIASATNSHFDETTKPEAIARNSIKSCAHFKSTMLRAYPERWRENYMKSVDAEVFQREVDWIIEARTKKNSFFR